MKPVFLWTDILLFLLLIIVLYSVRKLSNNPQFLNKWISVFSSKVGISTFIIIVTYLSIAVLDSLHFQRALHTNIENQTTGSNVQYEVKVTSVLDVLLGEMPNNIEKSYSAPFSLFSYSKSMLKDQNGKLYRDFERLDYGGAHLKKADDRIGDILIKSVFSIIIGLIISLFFIKMHTLYRKAHKRHLSFIHWKTAYITLSCIIIILTWLLYLGSYYHILGTDMSGNDVLYKSLKGIRTGVLIGTLATLIMLPIAIILGLSAGYFKGFIDDAVQYLYTTLSSIPSILLIAASVLLFNVYIENNQSLFQLGIEKADMRFLALCFILGVTSWATLCRLIRAETLKISQLDYVRAAHAFGVSHSKIIFRHILPNVGHIIIITFILDFSMLILAEAVLSYIGIGVDPSMASWGNMINSARSELSREPTVWWTLVGAFSFMFVLVLSANLFSDLVQDAFDPKVAKGVVYE